MQIYVRGYLETREYTDKQGNKRETTEVIVEEFETISGKEKNTIAGVEVEQVNGQSDDLPF